MTPPNTTNSRHDLSRREFLSRTAYSAGGIALATSGLLAPSQLAAFAQAGESNSTAEKLAFFVAGDTHYLASKDQPEAIDETSAAICGRLVDTMNRLPGEAIPTEAGGGKVIAPSGMIHTGDVIDTGDKTGRVQEIMQRTEWSKFQEDYGLTGTDGRLKYPVYEVYGNHDSPHGKGHALEQITTRSKNRKDVKNVSESGLHFSWDWGNVHFVNLGLIVGNDASIERKRRYAAGGSLDFLISDLKEHVGDSKRPIVITHHIDIARYTGPCDPSLPPDSKEWDPCDVNAFYRAIKDYNIAAIFYGHTHFRTSFLWDGTSPKATTGISVFNADNASHFGSPNQAFFYVEMSDSELLVREYQTKDSWQTGFFTPQVWRAPVANS